MLTKKKSLAKVNILITGFLTGEALHTLKKTRRFKITYAPHIKGSELLNKIRTAHGLIIRTETAITKELLSHSPNLKLICRAGIGVDHIDLQACKTKNIIVVNTPAGNRNSTAEFAVGLILALARNISAADLDMHRGNWNREKHIGVEIRGKTLGIIGLGNIGSLVAKKAGALGMNVIAYDPFIKFKKFKSFGVKRYIDLFALLRASDFVSLHVPLTESTRQMVDQNFLRKMKSSAYLINTSRGAAIKINDLVVFLRGNKIAGAAIDVFEIEPLTKKNRLRRLSNILLTPHEAGQTLESISAISDEAVTQIQNFFLRGIIEHQC
jgi:D-3-phosphoglycerate dehydrogenase